MRTNFKVHARPLVGTWRCWLHRIFGASDTVDISQFKTILKLSVLAVYQTYL